VVLSRQWYRIGHLIEIDVDVLVREDVSHTHRWAQLISQREVDQSGRSRQAEGAAVVPGRLVHVGHCYVPVDSDRQLDQLSEDALDRVAQQTITEQTFRRDVADASKVIEKLRHQIEAAEHDLGIEATGAHLDRSSSCTRRNSRVSMRSIIAAICAFPYRPGRA